MKQWKRFALAALAAGLAVLLAVALWRLDGASPGGTASPGVSPPPSAWLTASPASQTPAPSAWQSPLSSASPSPAPSASVSLSPAPSAPAESAAKTPSPDPTSPSSSPVPPGAAQSGVPPSSALPDEEEPQSADRCTLSVRCDTILDNLDRLNADKVELVPQNGVLIAETEEEFTEGESAFDLLKRVCQRQGVHLEFSITPGYGSAYIEGIGNLYEFDCGDRSGWIYRVNGEVPSKGCSAYTLQRGDAVEFLYTCDWGGDL